MIGAALIFAAGVGSASAKAARCEIKNIGSSGFAVDSNYRILIRGARVSYIYPYTSDNSVYSQGRFVAAVRQFGFHVFNAPTSSGNPNYVEVQLENMVNVEGKLDEVYGYFVEPTSIKVLSSPQGATTNCDIPSLGKHAVVVDSQNNIKMRGGYVYAIIPDDATSAFAGMFDLAFDKFHMYVKNPTLANGQKKYPVQVGEWYDLNGTYDGAFGAWPNGVAVSSLTKVSDPGIGFYTGN